MSPEEINYVIQRTRGLAFILQSIFNRSEKFQENYTVTTLLDQLLPKLPTEIVPALTFIKSVCQQIEENQQPTRNNLLTCVYHLNIPPLVLYFPSTDSDTRIPRPSAMFTPIMESPMLPLYSPQPYGHPIPYSNQYHSFHPYLQQPQAPQSPPQQQNLSLEQNLYSSHPSYPSHPSYLGPQQQQQQQQHILHNPSSCQLQQTISSIEQNPSTLGQPYPTHPSNPQTTYPSPLHGNQKYSSSHNATQQPYPISLAAGQQYSAPIAQPNPDFHSRHYQQYPYGGPYTSPNYAQGNLDNSLTTVPFHMKTTQHHMEEFSQYSFEDIRHQTNTAEFPHQYMDELSNNLPPSIPQPYDVHPGDYVLTNGLPYPPNFNANHRMIPFRQENPVSDVTPVDIPSNKSPIADVVFPVMLNLDQTNDIVPLMEKVALKAKEEFTDNQITPLSQDTDTHNTTVTVKTTTTDIQKTTTDTQNTTTDVPQTTTDTETLKPPLSQTTNETTVTPHEEEPQQEEEQIILVPESQDTKESTDTQEQEQEQEQEPKLLDSATPDTMESTNLQQQISQDTTNEEKTDAIQRAEEEEEDLFEINFFSGQTLIPTPTKNVQENDIHVSSSNQERGATVALKAMLKIQPLGNESLTTTITSLVERRIDIDPEVFVPFKDMKCIRDLEEASNTVISVNEGNFLIVKGAPRSVAAARDSILSLESKLRQSQSLGSSTKGTTPFRMEKSMEPALPKKTVIEAPCESNKEESKKEESKKEDSKKELDTNEIRKSAMELGFDSVAVNCLLRLCKEDYLKVFEKYQLKKDVIENRTNWMQRTCKNMHRAKMNLQSGESTTNLLKKKDSLPLRTKDSLPLKKKDSLPLKKKDSLPRNSNNPSKLLPKN